MRDGGGQIRNCRHIENHNSWRRAEDRAAIPGAYRDRYLDRVTINTDPPRKVGIIWGLRGGVTYTYSHDALPLPRRPSTFPHPVRRDVSSSSRRRSAIPRESNYFRYARDIGNARARARALVKLMLYARERMLRSCGLVLARRRLKARKVHKTDTMLAPPPLRV